MVIEAEIGDAVSGADAFGKKARSETFATLSKLGVGEGITARDTPVLFP